MHSLVVKVTGLMYVCGFITNRIICSNGSILAFNAFVHVVLMRYKTVQLEIMYRKRIKLNEIKTIPNQLDLYNKLGYYEHSEIESLFPAISFITKRRFKSAFEAYQIELLEREDTVKSSFILIL